MKDIAGRKLQAGDWAVCAFNGYQSAPNLQFVKIL